MDSSQSCIRILGYVSHFEPNRMKITKTNTQNNSSSLPQPGLTHTHKHTDRCRAGKYCYCKGVPSTSLSFPSCFLSLVLSPVPLMLQGEVYHTHSRAVSFLSFRVSHPGGVTHLLACSFFHTTLYDYLVTLRR